MNYWIWAVASICRNIAEDALGGGRNGFDFTRQFLRAGILYDQRPKAASKNFLELFPRAETIRVPFVDLQYKGSNANPFELYCLSCIAILSRATRVFEIGTYDGATALQLANACPDAELFTLDLAPSDVASAGRPHSVAAEAENVTTGGVGNRFAGMPIASRIHQMFGNSIEFDYGPYLQSMDVVFVDACHDYKYAKSDTCNALRLVRPGGTILWHDYLLGWPGVVRAVDELLPNYPVVHIAGTSLAMLKLSQGTPIPRQPSNR